MYIKDANNYDSCCLEWTEKDEEAAINLHKLTVRCWWNLHRYSWKWTTCAGFFKNHKQPLCHVPNSDLVLGLARGFVQVLTLTDYALTRKFFLTLCDSQHVYELTSYCHGLVLHSAKGPVLSNCHRRHALTPSYCPTWDKRTQQQIVHQFVAYSNSHHAKSIQKNNLEEGNDRCQCQNPAASIRRTVTANFSIANSCFRALLHGSHKSTL